MPTTFRVDLVAALWTVLEAQRVATPTLLRKNFKTNPGGFGEAPLAFIGGRDETILHDAGTRRRRAVPSVVLVDVFRPEVEIDALDQLVDALVDRFTAAYAQPGAQTVLELRTVVDGEIESRGDTPAIHRAVTLNFSADIMEGRT